LKAFIFLIQTLGKIKIHSRRICIKYFPKENSAGANSKLIPKIASAKIVNTCIINANKYFQITLLGLSNNIVHKMFFLEKLYFKPGKLLLIYCIYM